LPGQFRRRPPYLYQNDAIRRLVEAARRFDPSDELKNDTHATVLGLLAVTGMRVREALGLDGGNVDLKQGLLTIRHAKGSKSRLVPLHRSAQDALQQLCMTSPRSARIVFQQGMSVVL
jgi:integrase/recombinase XerD